MYKSFNTLAELFAHLRADKEWRDTHAAGRNRYPVRFVLFDNFADFHQFIVERPDGIYKHSIDTMLDATHPDEFLSYTELSNEIRAFAKKIPAHDFIICPFSEMARFYDNEQHKEFDSLVTTIRGQEAPEATQEEHVRIYIPIVGMQGKMRRFIADHSTYVWEYKSGSDGGTYRLIVTDGTTYGVSGIEEHYTVVKNLYEWLKLWEKGQEVKSTIICSSPNIFANACHAQPDNAFSYTQCRNAYEFLTTGLHLDFGVASEPSDDEMPYWDRLAGEIDLNDFNFDEFVKARLDTFTLNSGVDFIKSWFDCNDDFDRWLLTIYFRKVSDGRGYVYRVVSRCASLSKSELFSNIATLIFDEPHPDPYVKERREAMKLAAAEGVKITDYACRKLKAKLTAIAVSPERGGYHQAVKLLTPLTDAEQQLCIEWVASGRIKATDVKDIFPGLYHYLEPLTLNSLDNSTRWITDYFDAYRSSKIAELVNSRVSEIIMEKNGSPTAFYGWLDLFKTVRTVLHNRRDIDVYYWIDGLGVDWIPFVRDIIARYQKEHIYLNEIYVAAACLPTTTPINRASLQSLLPDGATLPKIGDVDAFAHSAKTYPQYIIDEMRIVEKAICDVLDNYNGRKIAFVSDHGLTYLSQYEDGLKIGGLIPNHDGRTATRQGYIVDDHKYVKLDDGKTLCALTHHSLTEKVGRGHGAHGGCTPEEVLVPIIIVSSQKNAATYAVAMETESMDGTHPIARMVIRGLSSIDVPTVIYNGVSYQLVCTGGDVFESERLNLVDTATKIKVCVNGEPCGVFDIKVSTGATEDDLFDF